jgi:hypothetical protein
MPKKSADMQDEGTEGPEMPEAPENVAAVKTAEEWATLRGHLPRTSPGTPPREFPKAVVPPVVNMKARHYDEARFLLWGGVVGKEMTLAEYDAAVEAATKHVFR